MKKKEGMERISLTEYVQTCNFS